MVGNAGSREGPRGSEHQLEARSYLQELEFGKFKKGLPLTEVIATVIPHLSRGRQDVRILAWKTLGRLVQTNGGLNHTEALQKTISGQAGKKMKLGRKRKTEADGMPPELSPGALAAGVVNAMVKEASPEVLAVSRQVVSSKAPILTHLVPHVVSGIEGGNPAAKARLLGFAGLFLFRPAAAETGSMRKQLERLRSSAEKALEDDDALVRKGAITALSFGRIISAIPALMNVAAIMPEHREHVLDTVQLMGPGALPKLRYLLTKERKSKGRAAQARIDFLEAAIDRISDPLGVRGKKDAPD